VDRKPPEELASQRGTSAALNTARMTSANTMRKKPDVSVDDDLINDVRGPPYNLP